MPNQEQSKDGIPRKDSDRPSPDVDNTYPGDGPSAPLGPPGAGLSDRNGPSDPDNRKL